MSRGLCHGICPVYYLEIDGDGKVIYRGYEHVNVTGEKTSSISPEKVKALVNEFYDSGYFSLKLSNTGNRPAYGFNPNKYKWKVQIGLRLPAYISIPRTTNVKRFRKHD